MELFLKGFNGQATHLVQVGQGFQFFFQILLLCQEVGDLLNFSCLSLLQYGGEIVDLLLQSADLQVFPFEQLGIGDLLTSNLVDDHVLFSFTPLTGSMAVLKRMHGLKLLEGTWFLEGHRFSGVGVQVFVLYNLHSASGLYVQLSAGFHQTLLRGV